MAFGRLLEQKLIEKNIKQAELAEAVKIPKTTLSSMISRDISKIDIESFLNICKYIDCDPEEFYNDYINDKPKPLSPSFVSKYNALDSYGKKTVDAVLDIEYERCASVTADKINEQKTYIARTAARNGKPPEEQIITQEELDEIRSRPDADWDL